MLMPSCCTSTGGIKSWSEAEVLLTPPLLLPPTPPEKPLALPEPLLLVPAVVDLESDVVVVPPLTCARPPAAGVLALAFAFAAPSSAAPTPDGSDAAAAPSAAVAASQPWSDTAG